MEGIISAGRYRPNVNDQPLWYRKTISDVWPVKSPHDHLHVYTSLCPSLGYLTEDACLLDSAEPGSYGKLVKHMKEGRILNDRPGKDVGVPPIALLYAPLVDFLTTFATTLRDSLAWIYESFNLPLTGLHL